MKKNITVGIDREVLTDVDALIDHLGVNRSAFASAALARHLEFMSDEATRVPAQHVTAGAGDERAP